MIHAVEAHLLMFVAGQTKHFERQKFDRAQQLASTLQQQRRVRTSKFDQNLRTLPVPLLSQRRIHRNAVFQTQAAMADNTFQQIVDFVGGGDFVGNGHKEALSDQPSAFSSFVSDFQFSSAFLSVQPQSLFNSSTLRSNRKDSR